jgi:hypothetical protein
MSTIEQRLAELETKMAKLELPTALPPLDTTTKTKKTKKEKKVKTDSDDEKPKKKRTSGYLIFCAAMRADVKEKLASECEEEKPKTTEVMKELAKMWRELVDEEKAVWNDKAQEVRDQDDA